MTEHGVAFWLIGFARALRNAGVAVDPARVGVAGRALATMTPLGSDEIYWATRVSLCSRQSDLPLFDAVFAAWSGSMLTRVRSYQEPQPAIIEARDIGTDGGDVTTTDAAVGESKVSGANAGTGESVKRLDLSELSATERAEINALTALLAPRPQSRRSMRYAAGGRRHLDASRTFRAMLGNGGELARLHHRRRRVRPRRLALLLDVSGSMNRYSDAYLRFAHAAVRARPTTTEVFTLSTRYERITRALLRRNPDRAVEAVARIDSDWGGGTRLGATLRDLLREWGGRDAIRGARVVIASDGWDEGAARALSRQVARLSQLSEVLIWVNPQAGHAGFRPVAPGLVSSLPYVDQFLPGRSFAELAALAEVIAHG
jgi:uncharacterized protein with von Willebrand factor type A (vWA) domain